MKTLHLVLPALIVALFALSFIPAVFADNPSANATPPSISSDSSNVLTVSDNAPFHLLAVTVTGPDGTVYKSTTCTTITTCNGDNSHSVILTFGTGLSGWKVTKIGTGCTGYSPSLNGPANTHCSGMYSYAVNGVALATTPLFHVGATFSAPQFGVSALLVAAIGMMFIVALRTKLSPRLKTSIN